MPNLTVYQQDNLEFLTSCKDKFNLIYIDPPFNTGRRQIRKRFYTVGGKKLEFKSYGYDDKYDSYIDFLYARLQFVPSLLTNNGSFFLHIDYREAHYVKIMLDELFGRECYINEIIWAYDYGARSTKKWSCKHDTIFWYVKDPKDYVFNYDAIDRIPYMAPNLVGEEKAARGKTPTDVWWNTIVSPNGKEKTGYATQKPLTIMNRIIDVHSNEGDTVCDFFAGSGSFGEAAYRKNRNCVLVDSNSDAIHVMKERFNSFEVNWR